jgi:hypothetical protein
MQVTKVAMEVRLIRSQTQLFQRKSVGGGSL